MELCILLSLKYCPVNQWLTDVKGYLFVAREQPSKEIRQPRTGSQVQTGCACLYCNLYACVLKLGVLNKSRLLILELG